MTEQNLTPDTTNHGETRATIKDALNKLGAKCTKEQKKEFAKIFVNIFEKGMSPKEAMRFPEKDLLAMYLCAYNQFSFGKFAEAQATFRALFMLDPKPAYLLSIGVCSHRLKQYLDAAMNYLAAGLADIDDPVPFFYAYGCFMALNNKYGAAMCLCAAIERAGEDKTHAALKREAQTLLDALNKEAALKEA